MPGSDRPGRPRPRREGAVALDGRADRAQEEHRHVARAQLRRISSRVLWSENSGTGLGKILLKCIKDTDR